MGKRVLALIIVVVSVWALLSPVVNAQEPSPEDQALYDEAADLVQQELNLLLELEGADDDTAIRERLAEVEAAGLDMMERLGEIIDFAPRIQDALSPFPERAGVVQPPNASQRSFYIDTINELRAGLPTANRAMAGGTIPPPAGGPLAENRPSPPNTEPIMTEGASTELRFALLGLAVLAAAGALTFWRRRDSEHAELIELVMTDELTRLSNRRRLEADLLSHADRPGELAVAMVDIDLFKQFNDRHGHLVGDHVLQQIGAAIDHNVRESDVVYRYGGEEFCILLPDASDDEAYVVVERVRTAIAALNLAEIDEAVTVSVGIALGASGHGAATLREADAALFKAKRAGRNRVVQHAEV